MKRGLLVFLAICAFAIAMVPRDRRAVNTDEEQEAPLIKGDVRFCAPQTPCAWSVYKPSGKIIDLNITNTYCVCDSKKECTMYEDDTSVSAYVYRCQEPKSGIEKPEDNS